MADTLDSKSMRKDRQAKRDGAVSLPGPPRVPLKGKSRNEMFSRVENPELFQKDASILQKSRRRAAKRKNIA